MPNDPETTCLECGAQLPPGMPPSQCPNCLFSLGLAAAEAEGGEPSSEVRDQKSDVGGQELEGAATGAEDGGTKTPSASTGKSEIANRKS